MLFTPMYSCGGGTLVCDNFLSSYDVGKGGQNQINVFRNNNSNLHAIVELVLFHIQYCCKFDEKQH